MRSENSARNSLAAIAGQTISVIFGFITRYWFIRVLGEGYLGVNGVFCSVLSLLSLTELGLGSAITYALYRPLADHDDEAAGRIMNLYAKAYRVVALVVTLLGLCLVPFLGFITRDVPEVRHVTLIYLLFLANSAGSYLFSYRRALVTASERDSRSTLNLAVFSVLQNLAQLVIIIVTGNYILYLAAQIVCTLASNIEISLAAKKMFPFLGKTKSLPDEETKKSIADNVKSAFISRFGSVAVTGTDNLLIASINVVLVGLYSNYLLILQTIQTILSQVMNAVTASVGNLIAEVAGERRREIYFDITFAVAWMYGFSAIALDCLMTPFIRVAFGAGLEIPETAVHLMALNFYLAGIRQPNLIYINAAGLFRPVRYKGFVEAAVNLGVSVLFLRLGMGLEGVLLGTTISHLATSVWWEPLAVDRNCLDGSMKKWMANNLVFGAVVALTGWGTRTICDLLPGGIGGFAMAMGVVVILPNAVFLALSFRRGEFRFFTGVVKRFAGKILRRAK
ncbi:MAG: hypothetical protein PUG87_02150 [Eubacteriales bacterium]|nr:hypothetical protein [Eubacteriales bacterium]